MGKKGILLSVASDQEGATPRIVTESQPLPVTMSEHLTVYSNEYTADASGNIDSHIAITAPSGGHLGVHINYIATDASGGTLNIDFVTSNIIIFRSYFSKRSTSSGAGAHIEGAVDEGITIVGTGFGTGDKIFVLLSYVTHNGN